MKNRLSTILMAVGALVLTMTACNGRKHDAAYYEQKVDSIRRAEQVAEIRRQAGIRPDADPAVAWLDSLPLRTLPLRNPGDDLEQIGQFVKVPMSLNENFNYPPSAKLKALAMPRIYRRNMVLLAEMRDSITSDLYLVLMDRHCQPLDKLCIYEKREVREDGDFGETFIEYFISSNYDITLMRYFQSHKDEQNPVLLDARRYIVNKEGRFEEAIIEL